LTASLSPTGIADITNNDPLPSHEPIHAQSILQDHVSVAGTSVMSDESTPAPSIIQHIPPSAELDFDLMWPDAEDLFETLMASEATNQWQMPLTTLPISSRSLYTSTSQSDTLDAFRDKGSPVGPIPSGESHKAVHNVSEMVSSLVGCALVRVVESADEISLLR